MKFDDVIERRHSARSFKSKKASWKDMLLAIDAAVKAPFAGNFNNHKYIVIENPNTIAKLGELAQQPWITEATGMIVVCSDEKMVTGPYGEQGKVYSRQQTGAAIENLILKLTDLGLDSCWIGSFEEQSVREVLGVPNNITIEALIPIGYEQKKSGKEKPRKRAMSDSIYWEAWESYKRPTAFQEAPRVKHPWK